MNRRVVVAVGVALTLLSPAAATGAVASAGATSRTAPSETRTARMTRRPIEGLWTPISTLGGRPVIWARSLHPLVHRWSVVAVAAIVDQSRLHAALFNGRKLPGGGP